MNIDQDLQKIALQEKRLKFKHFDSEVAWAVGTALKAAVKNACCRGHRYSAQRAYPFFVRDDANRSG
jgi:hypothetical protein